MGFPGTSSPTYFGFIRVVEYRDGGGCRSWAEGTLSRGVPAGCSTVPGPPPAGVRALNRKRGSSRKRGQFFSTQSANPAPNRDARSCATTAPTASAAAASEPAVRIELPVAITAFVDPTAAFLNT